MNTIVLWIAAALAIAVVGFTAGYTTGTRIVKARTAAAQARVQTAIDLRDVASADTSATMLDYLRVTIPAIETTKYETIERVRTLYRDRAVPGACVYPDGVREQIDAARERANRAASGLRPVAVGVAPARARPLDASTVDNRGDHGV